MFSFNVPMQDGSTYTVKSLLAKSANANAKIFKSNKAGVGIITHSLSLAPASESGFNLCSSSSVGCRVDCLYTSGNAMMFPLTIHPARIAKSRFLRLYKAEFIDRLAKELTDSVRYADRKGVKLAIRLNVYSDVMWEREFPGFLESFPTIQFYDYTKHYKRMLRYLNGELPSNYHLTFSRSEKNWHQCMAILSGGGNVAVPFHVKRTKPLPTDYNGYTALDGDTTDLRFLDPQGGFIIGLRAKGKGRKDVDSGFIVAMANAA